MTIPRLKPPVEIICDDIFDMAKSIVCDHDATLSPRSFKESLAEFEASIADLRRVTNALAIDAGMQIDEDDEMHCDACGRVLMPVGGIN